MNETQKVDCVWVPGTSDRVRLTLSGQVTEYRLSQVSKVFGPRVLDDMYLRGRVVLSPSKQQLSLLA